MFNVDNGKLTGNNCSFNDNYGIFLGSCDNINITENNIIRNNTLTGIYLYSSHYNLISKNDIGISKNGIELTTDTTNINISRNVIYNCSEKGINLDASMNNNVSYNIITNSSGNGILGRTSSCKHNLISYNNISRIIGAGIKLKEGTLYNTIYKNRINDINGNGIEFEEDWGISDILNNNIFNNSESGIFCKPFTMGMSNTNSIKGNTIYNNGHYGIHLYLCQNLEVFYNTIDNNGHSGPYQSGIIGNQTTTAYYKHNTISNNKYYGLYLTGIAGGGNYISNNTFINQPFHGYDDNLMNQWFEGALGNYYDDYWGVDFDDNGIGNDRYFIFGPSGRVDEYPIWWDAPIISNIYPVQGSTHGADAPEYKIKVDEGRGEQFWYEIIGTGENISHTNLEGGLRETTEGTINQTFWEGLSQGAVTIRFYVNDSRGWIGMLEVEVTKVLPKSPVVIIADDDDDDGEEDDPYLWIIRAAIAGAISASVGIVLKQSFSTVKKKRQLYELISKKLDSIDDVEGYLRDSLGKVDWEYFKPTYDQYINRKISQRELIKEGKKSMGKSFTELFEAKSKRKFAK